MNYNIEVSLESNNEFSVFLSSMIKDYNIKHSFHHNEVKKEGSIQHINIIVSDDNKQWIGGISAEIYWDWIEINHFWFRKELRSKGLGGLLLKKVEEIAKDKGAKKVLLTTFEFQARTFYEAKGFKVVGEIKDYPPGSSFYTMVKPLS